MHFYKRIVQKEEKEKIKRKHLNTKNSKFPQNKKKLRK
jgi:hypothetical protein